MILAFASAHGQENWPQFRGEDSTGVSHNHKLPIAWSTNLNVAWKTSIPGIGWSSPIVWGDRILITSVIKEGEVEPPRKGLYFGGERPTPSTSLHHWMVYCFDWQTGRKSWERQGHEGAPSSSLHLKNTYASETPVTDGERIYAYFGNVGLYSRFCGQIALVTGVGTFQNSQRLGHGRFAGVAQGSHFRG